MELTEQALLKIAGSLNSHGPGLSGDLIPDGVKFVQSLPYGMPGAIVVHEQRPCWRTMRVANPCQYSASLNRHYGHSVTTGATEYTVSFPYVVSVVLVQIMTHAKIHLMPRRLEVYFNTRPLESLDDKLFRSCLLNVKDDCACLAGIAYRGEPAKTWQDAMQIGIMHVYESGFNSSHGEYQLAVCNMSMEMWRDMSQEDEFFWKTYRWPQADSPRNRVLSIYQSLIYR